MSSYQQEEMIEGMHIEMKYFFMLKGIRFFLSVGC